MRLCFKNGNVFSTPGGHWSLLWKWWRHLQRHRPVLTCRRLQQRRVSCHMNDFTSVAFHFRELHFYYSFVVLLDFCLWVIETVAKGFSLSRGCRLKVVQKRIMATRRDIFFFFKLHGAQVGDLDRAALFLQRFLSFVFSRCMERAAGRVSPLFLWIKSNFGEKSQRQKDEISWMNST